MAKRDRALLTGHKAKQMFGDMAGIAMKIADNASATLLANYNGDEEAAVAAISQVLKDARRLERIMLLLETGDTEQAEKLILRTGE